MIEPENYDKLTRAERKKLRERYVEDQRGKCYHCHEALDGKPLNSILKMKVDAGLFPEGFFDNPVHLHHDHKTSKTIGAVHAHCNAVLWVYFGE